MMPAATVVVVVKVFVMAVVVVVAEVLSVRLQVGVLPMAVVAP